jgi:uncharacterized protein
LSGKHWEQLLAVQELDSAIQKLDHRDANLPERERLTGLEQRLARVRAEASAAEDDKHELVRQQKRLEDEIASLEDKIAKEESQLYSGGSSDAGMLQALQDEIASLKRRVAVLEDEELELMERIEPIDARLEALGTERSELDGQATEALAALAEVEAQISEQRGGLLGRRQELVTGIDQAAVDRYEQTRDRLGGTAVARLESGSCGGCHMKLSAVEHDRIMHLPVDEEVRCEECGRFLVRG